MKEGQNEKKKKLEEELAPRGDIAQGIERYIKKELNRKGRC